MRIQATGDSTEASSSLSADIGNVKYPDSNLCNNRDRNQVFAQALPHDGALTWDVPERLDHAGLIPSQAVGAPPIVFDDILEGQRHVLGCVYFDHLCEIADQLIKSEGVQNEEVWKPVLVDLARQAASLISPQQSIQKGVFDPRQHVKVEVLPELGSPGDSFVVQGVLLRKNIPHKGMRSKICNPRVLLLRCALELESSKLQALTTMVQQELAFLKSAVARISACKPDILVVERNVAGFAVRALENEGITLVYNVTAENLQKLAINLDTQIVESISDISNVTLGTCKEFSVNMMRSPSKVAGRTKRAKIPPLMMFSGCPKELACSIVLKGEIQSQLHAIAKVVEFTTYAAYHMRLELAFLLDETAISTASLAAAVQGFPTEMDKDRWHRICRGLIFNSVHRAQAWRGERPIASVSPHIAGWSPADARTPVHQPKDYIIPYFDPAIEVSSPVAGSNLMPEPTLTKLDWDSMYESIGPDEPAEETGEHLLQDSARVLSAAKGPSHMRSQPPVSVFQNCQEYENQLAQGVPGPALLDRRLSGGTAFEAQQSPLSTINHSFCSSMNTSTTDVEDVWRSKDKIAGEAVESPSNQDCEIHIYSSQKFTSNFANRNHRKGLLCEPAHVESMEFYGENDCTLEGFLMTIAADPTKRCPHGCGGGNSSHVRTFLHGGMRLTVSVVSLPCEKELPGESQIWFWARPKGFSSEPLPSVRRILLSEDTKCMSLGQFLDLSCNTQHLEVLGRQLHLEFVRYFGYGRTVACVYQDRIRPYALSLPDLELECSMRNVLQWLKESAAELFQESNNAYKAIEDALLYKSGAPVTEPKVHKGHIAKANWVPQIQLEQRQFSNRVNQVVSRVSRDSSNASEDLVLDCLLELNRSRRQLAINVLTWSAKLQDPKAYTGAMKADLDDQTDSLASEIGTLVVDSAPYHGASPKHYQRAGLDQSMEPNSCKVRIDDDVLYNEAVGDFQGLGYLPSPFAGPSHVSDPWDDVPFNLDGPEENGSENGNRTDDSGLRLMSPFAVLTDRPFSPESSWCAENDDLVVENTLNEERVFSMDASLERFPAINPDPESTSSSARQQLRRNSSAGDLHAMLDWEASQFLQDSSLDLSPRAQGGRHHRRWASDPISPKGEPLFEQLGRRLMPSKHHQYAECDQERLEAPMGVSGANPVLRVNSQVRSQLKPGTVPLTNGFFLLNGRSLSTRECDDVVIPFFETEPASIVAHALASIGYQRELKSAIDGMHAAHQAPSQQHPTLSSEEDGLVYHHGSSGRGCYTHLNGNAAILLCKAAVHITQKFEDNPPGMPWSQAKFQVVSYYAPQFAKLREYCIRGGERSFIMSLSRCKRWQAQGGKSNAYFAKTRDDRYIIKSLSKSEKASLIDNFGPAYFQHMYEALRDNRQVALAKILGVFQISMKSRSEVPLNDSLGKDWVLDVIVMENAFYNRTMDRTYDLKGSKRSRFSSEAEENPSGKGTVYLDSNLRKHNLSAPPLLVDKASLEGLEATLQKDCQFLCEQLIMDYSLLVGLDKENSTLVVAIIDFIRQYTWDKRLETLAKSSGIIGGKKEGSEEPTVISPNLYMKRFVSTITSYFHVVPTRDDDWCLESVEKPDAGEYEG